ncbi:hypothetical protein CHS0354_015648 [Potamilus streckersoni]|uniref:Uncharacterized protein n=1 Tax=Potamilus streckersoni TaxID=2493646 RepID=A0AAE0SEJ8_9BIVA|nr:hypothetical protein CHS0354_015648 [Potamilus streckersoni]
MEEGEDIKDVYNMVNEMALRIKILDKRVSQTFELEENVSRLEELESKVAEQERLIEQLMDQLKRCKATDSSETEPNADVVHENITVTPIVKNENKVKAAGSPGRDHYQQVFAAVEKYMEEGEDIKDVYNMVNEMALRIKILDKRVSQTFELEENVSRMEELESKVAEQEKLIEQSMDQLKRCKATDSSETEPNADVIHENITVTPIVKNENKVKAAGSPGRDHYQQVFAAVEKYMEEGEDIKDVYNMVNEMALRIKILDKRVSQTFELEENVSRMEELESKVAEQEKLIEQSMDQLKRCKATDSCETEPNADVVHENITVTPIVKNENKVKAAGSPGRGIRSDNLLYLLTS